MLIYRETFLYKASTENLGHSNEESEHFKGSGVQFSCNQCYWKKNPANKENRNNKTKRIACPSTCTTGISKPTKRKTTRPRVGNEWGKILV